MVVIVYLGDHLLGCKRLLRGWHTIIAKAIQYTIMQILDYGKRFMEQAICTSTRRYSMQVHSLLAIKK